MPKRPSRPPKPLRETKIPNAPVWCGYCNNKWDSCFEVTNSNQPPQLGDIFLCPKCGTPNTFSLVGGWREMTDNDFNSLTAEERRDLYEAMSRIQYDNLMADNHYTVLNGKVVKYRDIPLDDRNKPLGDN